MFMPKMITIRWNSIDDITSKIRYLKARKRELQNANGCSKTIITNGAKLDACNNIWNTDISSIYSDLNLRNEKEFFVYAHLNVLAPIDLMRAVDVFAASIGFEYLPFYIGKGINRRDKSLRRNETHRKITEKIRSLGEKEIVIKVRNALSESEALQVEAKLMDIFGFMTNGGCLTNLDEGFHSTERRILYRESLLKLVRNYDHYQQLKKDLFYKL